LPPALREASPEEIEAMNERLRREVPMFVGLDRNERA
jgi:hypothetical protein